MRNKRNIAILSVFLILSGCSHGNQGRTEISNPTPSSAQDALEETRRVFTHKTKTVEWENGSKTSVSVPRLPPRERW